MSLQRVSHASAREDRRGVRTRGVCAWCARGLYRRWLHRCHARAVNLREDNRDPRNRCSLRIREKRKEKPLFLLRHQGSCDKSGSAMGGTLSHRALALYASRTHRHTRVSRTRLSRSHALSYALSYALSHASCTGLSYTLSYTLLAHAHASHIVKLRYIHQIVVSMCPRPTASPPCALAHTAYTVSPKMPPPGAT